MGGALADGECSAPPRGGFGFKGAAVSGFDRVKSVARAESPLLGRPETVEVSWYRVVVEVAPCTTDLSHSPVCATGACMRAKLHFDVLHVRPIPAHEFPLFGTRKMALGAG